MRLNAVLSARIRALLDSGVEEGKMAGASALILHRGEEVAYAQSGWADREAGTPIARDTIFRLYSMTKPVTAAACMKLVEQGLLDLGEAVSAYLPSFENQQVWKQGRLVPAGRPVTVHDLMGMTAGLSYPGTQDVPAQAANDVFTRAEADYAAGREWNTRRVADEMAKCPLAFEPGTSWRYGTCADVLGAVIETVSGRRLGEWMQDVLFEPLGMRDTAFYVPETKQARLAAVYEKTDGGLRRFEKRHLLTGGRYEKEPAFESGGAGLCSTLDDYARFAQMLLGGGVYGGRRILSARSVACMTRAQVSSERMENTWDSLLGYGYGHLMRVLEKPGKAHSLGCRGEYGWDGWLGAYFVNDPHQALTILFMMQRTGAGTNDVTRRLRNIVYAGLTE